MFLVLVVHSDFLSLSGPAPEEFFSDTLNALTRTLFQSLSIVCVNVFILISGWFGIKLTKKGVLNFLLQCGYFIFGIYFVMILLGRATLSFRGITDCFLLNIDGWFIKAYLALLILSPVLNAFVEKASRRMFQIVLVLFFMFQTFFGWTQAADWVNNGYSTFSFMGLYLLARYMRIFGLPFLETHGGWLYLLSALASSGAYFLLRLFEIDSVSSYSYVSPFVILGAVGLFSFFNNLKIGHSKIINWVAASAFAVYLFHTDRFVLEPIFAEHIRLIYQTYSGVACLAVIGLYDVVIFVFAILLDQPRKYLRELLF